VNLDRPTRDEIPAEFRAFLAADGTQRCRECVTRAELREAESDLEDPDAGTRCTSTIALGTDSWYCGGACSKCGDVILHGS
jgi:hypothetical protein